MVAIAAERRRFTLLEFLALSDELERAGAQEWFEIIEGELVAHASADDPHMRAAAACYLFLGDAQRAGYGQVGNDRTVALDSRGSDRAVAHAYKPDAFFVARGGHAVLRHPETPSVVGAPDVVVEVLSPNTARFDRPPRGKKFRGYEEYGVRVYWLVDTRRQTVTTYERHSEHLVETAVLHPGDTLRCPLFPDLALAIEEIFRTPEAGSSGGA